MLVQRPALYPAVQRQDRRRQVRRQRHDQRRSEKGRDGRRGAAARSSASQVVLVHGGGPETDRDAGRGWTCRVRFVNGLRVTDRETAQVVLMVLAGKINKSLVNLLARRTAAAPWACRGIDGHMIQRAHARRVARLCGRNHRRERPTRSSTCSTRATSPSSPPSAATTEGSIYNINADTAAARIAGRARRRKPDHDDRHQRHPARLRGRRLAHPHGARVAKSPRCIKDGVITGGMIPKVECCAEAVRRGVPEGVHHRRARAPLDHRRDANRRGLGHHVHQIKGGTPHLNTFEKDSAYIAHAYGRLPLEFARASGSEVFGQRRQRRYIDLGSGIAVNAFGHCRPGLDGGGRKAARRVRRTPPTYYYSAPQRRAGRAALRAHGAVAACSSPTPAPRRTSARSKRRANIPSTNTAQTEASIVTLTRLLPRADDGHPRRHRTGRVPSFLLPLPDRLRLHAAEGCRRAGKARSTADVCALLLELVQGEGGVNALSRNFVRNRRRALRRAGYSAAHRRGADRQRPQRHALRVRAVRRQRRTSSPPAKGLGGGLPIGATLLGAKTADTLTPCVARLHLRRQPGLRGRRGQRYSTASTTRCWPACGARARTSAKRSASTPPSKRSTGWG